MPSPERHAIIAYVPADGEIRHVDETLKLMSAITGDNSFEDAVNLLTQNGKESISMCEVVQNFRKDGYKKAQKKYEPLLEEQACGSLEQEEAMKALQARDAD